MGTVDPGSVAPLARDPGGRGPIPDRWVTAAHVLLMVLAPFVAFPLEFIRSGLLDGGDDALANLPELVYSARQLLHGEVLWGPELWMGHSLLGDPEFATLYVPRLLLLAGPPVTAYVVYVLLHFVAAELGAYAYVRTLGVSRSGALFGAFAYAFTGFMLGHRGHTMYVAAGAWTPLVLILFDRAVARGRRRDVLGAAVAFAMLPFSGAVQLTVYLAGVITALGAVRAVLERRPRELVAPVLCLVPALLVSALQILPAMGLSRQLATELRAGPTSADMSFHPALFPTLFLPMLPGNAEHYARVGVTVLCAAWVAVRSYRAAPTAVRAWIVVAGGAFVLMLGAYVPPLAAVLERLPLIKVLRFPVRHNFELGLAVAVLAAYGMDLARSRAHEVRRWVTGGAVVALASLLAVWVGSRDSVTGATAALVLRQISARIALGAALAFALWVMTVSATARRARVLWALMPLSPLLELAWTNAVDTLKIRNFHSLVEVARAALPRAAEGELVRVLPRPFGTSNLDSLAGNSVLLHPGVQNVAGYASIAYAPAKEVLDLDMHGHAAWGDDLAWSTLPSVFGVTHVVLPRVVCGSDGFRLGVPGECARADAAVGPPSLAGALSCTFTPTGPAVSYDIRVRARAPSRETPGFTIGLYANAREELFVKGSELAPELRPFAARVAAFHLSPLVNFGGSNEGDVPIELVGPELVEDREVVVADLVHGPATRSVRAERGDGAVRLDPQGEVALVERRISRPEAVTEVELELEARALAPGAGDVVLDLYDPGGFDPEDVQVVIPGGALGPEWAIQRRVVALDGAPPEPFVRVLTLGRGAVEVKRATVRARFTTRVTAFPVTRGPPSRGFVLTDGGAVMKARASVGGAMNMPVRAFELRLAPGAGEAPSTDVDIGLSPNPDRLRVGEATRIPRAQLRAGVTTWTVHAAPDVPSLALFARRAVPAPGASPVPLVSLEARDACSVRGYRNPRPLAHGLFLYENPGALPRAYTASEVVPVGSAGEARRVLRGLSPDELGRRVTVQGAAPGPLGPGRVESQSFTPRRVEVTVTAGEKPTLLVVNDRWAPTWVARVDGTDAPVLTVNGLVRGVVVPPGRHRVELAYVVPAAVWAGLACALVGVLASVVVVPLALRLLSRRPALPAPGGGT